MVTRRELVAAGAIGAMSAAGLAEGAAAGAGGAAAESQSAEQLAAQSLSGIQEELAEMRRLLRGALVGPSLSDGIIAEVRRQFGLFLRPNQKYPDYCEIGPAVFTDIYDWHVRHQQPIEIGRHDGRMTIRFMFTWMVLRPEQDPAFVGIPFDRG